MNLKRSLALTLSVLLILTAAIPVAMGAGEPLERLKGANKWETAVKICQEGWESADAVVLASGEKFADALAGVPLAAALDAPILLTKADSLVKEAKDEIVRLGATEVYILGGTAAISADVEEELEAMDLEVTRVKGNGRAETAVEISKLVAPDGSDTVVLVYAWDFPDALAAASYAAAAGYPILLTEKTYVPEVTLEAIEDLGADNIVVVGGTAVITEAAVEDLEGVERIKGANREETSVKLAERFAPDATMFYIATGDGFADAIAGAALAAKNDTGILLVRSGLNNSVATFLSANVFEAVVFGGTGAVSATVEAAIRAKMAVADTGIAGFVYDVSDAGVEDVVVSVGTKSATTDEDGFFFIAGVAPGEHTVTAKLAGWEIAEVEDVEVVADGISVANVYNFDELDSGNILIEAVVYDNDTSASVADYVVTFEVYNEDEKEWVDALLSASSITATTGSFTIDNTGSEMDFGDVYRLTVTKEIASDNEDAVYKTFVKVITLDEYAERNTVAVGLVPVKEGTISGVVKDADGEVVDAQTVELYFDAEETPFEATTNAKGEFEFEGTYPSGTYTIKAELTGHAVYSDTFSLSEGAELTRNIQFKDGYEVSVELGTNPVGEQFVAASTAVAKLYQGKALVQEGLVVVSADSIAITFGDDESAERYGIAAGTYTLEVSGDYLTTTEFTIKVTSTVQDFTNRIVRAGIISGNVNDGAEVAVGYEDATVQLLKGTTVVDEVETDSNGDYEFAGVPAGSYTVEVSLDGYMTDSVDEVEVTVNNETTVEDFVLEAVVDTGVITGFLRELGTMDLISDAEIIFYQWDDEAETWDTYSPDTYASGEYTATLDEGDYTMVIRNLGSYETVELDVTIVAEKTLTKNFVITPGGNGTLTLIDEDELAVTDGDADITAITLEDEYDVDYYSNIDAELPAGTYTLTIDFVDDTYVDITKTIKIAKGGTTTFVVDFEPVPDETTVNFRVLTGFPGSGEQYVDIAVVNAKGELVDYAVTGSTGAASIDLVDGKYTVKAYANGYLLDTKTIEVKYDEDDPTLDVPVFYLTAW